MRKELSRKKHVSMQLVEIMKQVLNWVWPGKLFCISLRALASQMVSASVSACVNGEPPHRPEACMTYDRTEGVAGTLDTWCDKNQS